MAKSLLKSAPIKKKRSITPRGFDAKHMGDEPSWENQHLVDDDERQTMLGRAYNWYNYFYEPKTGRKWLVEYMTEQGMSRAAVSMTNRVSDIKLSSTMCNTARMLLMGLEDQKLQDKLNNYLVSLVEQGVAIAKAEKAAAAKVAPAYDKNPASDLIATIEEMIDHDPDEEWRNSFYSWLKDTKQVKPTQARAIADYYRPWLEELREVSTTKDAELKYAYRHLNKKNLKERIALFDGIVRDCESLVSNSRKTVTRKSRNTKPKTADKIVSKIKFQKEDTNLKIVSIDPTKIVGANELWVFNTRYNVLAHYVADAGGLSMKGTTLQNVSDASRQKKLRKPSDVLPKITGSTAKAAERAFTSLKTKENNPNGRINECCIILRAVK